MCVTVSFCSHFKDLPGRAQVSETAPEGSTLADLFERLSVRFPQLGAMRKSTLMAVRVDYQVWSYVWKPGDEASIFLPVQEDRATRA
jgi:molybdopterin converting factor small subunit